MYGHDDDDTTRIHRIPDRATATVIAAEPTIAAGYVCPADEEPQTFDLHYRGKHKIEFSRQMHLVMARGIGYPRFRLYAIDDLPAWRGRDYKVPNVHAPSGEICWGGGYAPKDLAGFDNKFWHSPFNDHLARGFPGWGRNGHVTPETAWRRHYANAQANPQNMGFDRVAEPKMFQKARTTRELALNGRNRWASVSFADVALPEIPRHLTLARWRYPNGPTLNGLVSAAAGNYKAVIREECQKAKIEPMFPAWQSVGRPYATAEELIEHLPTGSFTLEHWNALSSAGRKRIVKSGAEWRRYLDLVDGNVKVNKLFFSVSKAIGCRIGQRGLDLESRTPKQQKDEVAVLGFLDLFAEFAPKSAELHRKYFKHMIAAHVPMGKVRARRTELKEQFMAANYPDEGGDEADARLVRIGNYFNSGWRERSTEGTPVDARNIQQEAVGGGYYLGPRTDAVFLTSAAKVLEKVPATHHLRDGFAGAWAMRKGKSFVLIFPSKKKGIADPFRATCDLNGKRFKAA